MSDSTSSGFDPNRVAAEVITDLTKDFVSSSKNSISRFVRKNIVNRFASFEKYIQRTYNRCSTVRIILDKDRVYQLRDVYVGAMYGHGNDVVSDNELGQRLRDGGKLVVQGFGGIGKTILLKHLWLSVFDNPEGRIPLFFELKRLNDISSVRLEPYIRGTLTDGDLEFTADDFSSLCTAGRFIFMLDAFDEINDDKRDEIEREIIALSHRYPKCGVLVSSRKDHRFYSWDQFEVYHAKPFAKEQITAVIRKVDFDRIVRKKFLEDIISTKYDQFSDFLSTPLLALMMLLMYRQFAEVPEKIHIFYRYAFQTLYSLHDAAKESFTRQRKTRLNEDEFAKLFSMLCMLSYVSMTNTFSVSGIRTLVEAAKTRCGISVDTDKFIEEAIESVNLLYQEGDMISFVHRSFQEYFTAFCIMNFFSNRLPEIVAKLPNRPDDSVLMMSYEMNADLFEDNYIIPQYKRYRGFLDDIRGRKDVEVETLVDLKAMWIFFFAPGRKLVVLQEGLYAYSLELDFCDRVARAVDK